MALTCSNADQTSACPLPSTNAANGRDLVRVLGEANFTLSFPCFLPAGQTYDSGSVIGDPGRQQAELLFAGPFSMAIRQAQFPPNFNPDPTGTSTSTISLFPNVQAQMIERYDGSDKTQYHVFWLREGIYYEVQVVGPPQQRRAILQIARSLEPLSEDGTPQNPQADNP